MGNRVMAAKRLKMKRMRRAWATPLSRASGCNPNRIVINEYKQRARGLMLDDDISESIIQKFCHEADRREALARQAKYELELGNAMRFRGPGPCNNYEESWIYFNSSKSAFFILHLDKKIGIQRKSISYSCKEILITKWNMGKVTWVEIEDLPALT